jgi:hypothetical protein
LLAGEDDPQQFGSLHAIVLEQLQQQGLDTLFLLTQCEELPTEVRVSSAMRLPCA